MKKLFFAAAFLSLGLLTAFTGFTQDRDFDGIWTGNLKKNDGTSLSLTLYIENNIVYSVTKNDDGKRIKASRDEEVTRGYGEQLNYFWINKGGVWTETQFHSIVWVNKNKISVHFIRHVSNEDSDESNNIDNTDWGYTATGYLYKE
jgi:hypothetical protein